MLVILVSLRVNARTQRGNWTEPNWHGLAFEELTSGQAERTHCSLIHSYAHVY